MGRQFQQASKSPPYLDLGRATSPFMKRGNSVPDMVTYGKAMTFSDTSIVKYTEVGAAIWTLPIATAKADATKFLGTGYYDSSAERLYILLWKSGNVAMATVNTNTGALVAASGEWYSIPAWTTDPTASKYLNGNYQYYLKNGVITTLKGDYSIVADIATRTITAINTAAIPSGKLYIYAITLSGDQNVVSIELRSSISTSNYYSIILTSAFNVPYFLSTLTASISLIVGEVFIFSNNNSSMQNIACYDLTKFYDAIDDLLIQRGITNYTVLRRDEL